MVYNEFNLVTIRQIYALHLLFIQFTLILAKIIFRLKASQWILVSINLIFVFIHFTKPNNEP